MSTPGQIETNDSDVLNEIVKELRTVTGLGTSTVFVTAEPIFFGTSYMGQQYVEVVPGGALDDFSKAGTGYIRADFRIITFKRLLIDMKDQDTQRIANASLGLFNLVRDITDKLTQNYLDDQLVIPMRPVSRTSASAGPIVGSGWASVERVFEATYRVAFSDPSNFTP